MDAINVTFQLKPPIGITANLRNKADTSIIFIYPVDSELSFETTIAAGDEGDYTTQALINISTIEYRKNAAVVTLPFSLAVGDIIKETITKTNALLESRAKITGTRLE